LAALAAGSCYNVILPPVEMGNASASEACEDLISRVFAASGFVPVSMQGAPPMMFAPRTTAPLGYALTTGWAIGVSFTGASAGCSGFQLQALSPEPECMPEPCLFRSQALQPAENACYGITVTCPLSPTGSTDLRAATDELTRRIRAAIARTGVK
jgi:hypothetical protein